MQVVYECCCGLDVHKKTVVACLIRPNSDSKGTNQQEVRTFSTMTSELLELADWLGAAGCTHVAIESTGVFWKPIFNLLEGSLEVILVNARHVKAVPGRKTDVKDSEWLASLLQHGLLKASFIPPLPQRELRELTRYRTSLVGERARLVNRLQKVLEDANLKLGAVATDVTGVSARAMLKGIVEGETDPAKLAVLAKKRMRQKMSELEQALSGRVRDHHRFMLAQQLAHLEYLEEQIEAFNAEIERKMSLGAQKGSESGPLELAPPQQEELKAALAEVEELAEEKRGEVDSTTSDQNQTPPLSYRQAVELLDTIPGVNQRIAEIILAEVGLDMSRFASANHLASWAGMCPGNRESGGKRLSGRTRKGSQWLRQALVEAAQGAMRSRDTYLNAQGRRLADRRGLKKAVIAVGHTILVTAYYLLTRRKSYLDLGANYFDQQERQKVERQAIKRLERLGYKVTLETTEAGQAA